MTDETRGILADAFEEVSPLLTKSAEYSDELALMGNNGVLDSMALVSFISAVETQISDKLDKNITIVSDKAFSQKYSPFLTMETLGSFVETLLRDE